LDTEAHTNPALNIDKVVDTTEQALEILRKKGKMP